MVQSMDLAVVAFLGPVSAALEGHQIQECYARVRPSTLVSFMGR